MRFVIAACITAAIAHAQFTDLATTADGLQVYFATTLRLAAEAPQQIPTTAIYRVSAGAVPQRMTAPSPFDPTYPISQGNTQVSDDGNVWSYTESQSCTTGSSCIFFTPATTSHLFVQGPPARSEAISGTAQISPNGRFVWKPGAGTVDDLQTGTTAQPPLSPAAPQQDVTDDGAVLGFDNGALVLWTAAGSRTIATAEQPASAIVNAAGTWVAYETNTATAVRLHSVDVATSADTLTATLSGSPDLSISARGDHLMYLNAARPDQPAQVWLAQLGQSGATQLTHYPQGVDAAVLDGNGDAVIAAAEGRLLRIDVQTGAATELIGRTPTCYAGFITLIPGSILPIYGMALADVQEAAPTPLPADLAGTRVLVNETPLPLLSIAPHEVWFQVPFDLPLQPSVSVELEHSSFFEGCPAMHVPVVARQPYFFSATDAYLILAHEDFGSVVSRAAPVQPNEIVHAYAVGLGAVTPPMETGIPTPASPLHQLTEPFNCVIGASDSTEQLDVLFAGLAPGMIGIYQVDVRMPSTLPGGDFFLNCGTPGVVKERHGGEVPAP